MTAKQPLFTALDRCDRCGAPAALSAAMASGTLLFCGHHARLHQVALVKQALVLRQDAVLAPT